MEKTIKPDWMSQSQWDTLPYELQLARTKKEAAKAELKKAIRPYRNGDAAARAAAELAKIAHGFEGEASWA